MGSGSKTGFSVFKNVILIRNSPKLLLRKNYAIQPKNKTSHPNYTP